MTGDLLPRKAAPSQLKLFAPLENDTDNFYEVDTVLQHRGEAGHREYKVSWSGYSLNEATWEPAANLSFHTIKSYWERIGLDRAWTQEELVNLIDDDNPTEEGLD
jgi:hypothetical protein